MRVSLIWRGGLLDVPASDVYQWMITWVYGAGFSHGVLSRSPNWWKSSWLTLLIALYFQCNNVGIPQNQTIHFFNISAVYCNPHIDLKMTSYTHQHMFLSKKPAKKRFASAVLTQKCLQTFCSIFKFSWFFCSFGTTLNWWLFFIGVFSSQTKLSNAEHARGHILMLLVFLSSAFYFRDRYRYWCICRCRYTYYLCIQIIY